MAAKFPWSTASNIKVVLNGGQKVTFIRSDGYFAFQGVTAGTHLLEVVAIGCYFTPFVFSSVRSYYMPCTKRNPLPQAVWRSFIPPWMLSRLMESKHAWCEWILAHDFMGKLTQLQWRPAERREPFSVMSLLKSPMGLTEGFMLVAVFLLPKLMDIIDPEEMKRVQEEM